jgi:hypothetical protein
MQLNEYLISTQQVFHVRIEQIRRLLPIRRQAGRMTA